MQEFGFSHPVLLDYDRAVKRTIIDPDALRQAVEDAIVKERTLSIKVQGTRQRTPATSGTGPMGGGRLGGGMSGYSTNAIEMAMGPGGSTGVVGLNQDPLLDLARSNAGSGIGNNMSMSGTGMERGTNAVIDMIKLLKDHQKLDANKFEAVVQFVWIPKTPTEREEAKKAAAEKLLAAQAAAQGTDEQTPDDGITDETTVDTTVTPGVDATGVTGQPDSQTVTPVTVPDDTTSPSVPPDDTSNTSSP